MAVYFLTYIALFGLLFLNTCISSNNLHYREENGRNDVGDYPNYPISASYFRDRFTLNEWDETLDNFAAISGDTVILRAPELKPTTPEQLRKNPLFLRCVSSDANGVNQDCVSQAQFDMLQLGLKIKAFATYTYEENYSNIIMKCPIYDRKIVNGQVFYRLVFSTETLSSECNLEQNSEVMVVFTTFNGTDPHELLVQSAAKKNMSVYFGLPSAPKVNSKFQLPPDNLLGNDLIVAYYNFVNRVLQEHAQRFKFHSNFNSPTYHGKYRNNFNTYRMNHKRKFKDTSNPIVGYYSNDQGCLGFLGRTGPGPEYKYSYIKVYSILGKMIRSYNLKFMISPSIDLNKFTTNYTVTDHVNGFKLLMDTKSIDVIAVQEARGRGKGCYYFDTQIDDEIGKVDPGLLKVLQNLYPNISSTVTYRDQYLGSNNQLFKLLSDSRDAFESGGNKIEFWLDVDAYEATNDSVCLPIDPMNSGMPVAIDRTSKSRVDWAIATAGVYVNKVAAFAWDPDFTCQSSGFKDNLQDEILSDCDRPIIVYCGWHSKANMSLVVIGHSLLSSLTQSFSAEYQTREGEHKSVSELYGYYFESAWGQEHGRLPSLIYTQMFDLPDPYDVSLNGTVKIKAGGGFHACVFTYDFRDP